VEKPVRGFREDHARRSILCRTTAGRRNPLVQFHHDSFPGALSSPPLQTMNSMSLWPASVLIF
jgi:hypothetical protein